jgi:uncharacterized iron-regulated membrane protein
MKIVRRSHLYIGTACGILWLLSALSGGILAASDRQNAVPLSGTQISLSQALTAAKDYGAEHPANIMFPTTTSPDYVVTQRHEHDMLRVFIDARTGTRIIPSNDPLTWLNRFHENLLLGTSGRVILTTSGILLAFMSVSGALIWLPRRRANWKDTHRISGVFAVLPILLAALTGIALQIQALSPRGEHAGTDHASAKHGKHRRHDRLAARLEPAIQAARQSVPDAHVERVQLPQKAGDPIIVTMLSAQVRNPLLESNVSVDPRNAAIVELVTPKSRPPLERFYAAMRALHMGVFAGIITQLLTILSAILLTATIVTGFWRARFHFAKWLGKRTV